MQSGPSNSLLNPLLRNSFLCYLFYIYTFNAMSSSYFYNHFHNWKLHPMYACLNAQSNTAQFGLSNFRISSTEGPFLLTKLPMNNQTPHHPKSTWKHTENIDFVLFLDYNRRELTFGHSQPVRWNLYKQMASFIKSRNANQCRMHHNRMHEAYGSDQKIIQKTKETTKHYQQIYQSRFQELKETSLSKTILHKTHILKPIQDERWMSKIDDSSSYQKSKDDMGPTADSYIEHQPLLPLQKRSVRPSFSMDTPPLSKPTLQEQWIDCHESFIIWANKMNSLAMKLDMGRM